MEMVMNKSKQSGVVLVAALVMIIAVTGIAVSLMSSSTLDLKMVNAAQESETAEMTIKGDAELSLRSAMDLAANNPLIKGDGQFTDAGMSIKHQNADPKSTITLFNEQTGPEEMPCPRRFAPTPGIVCNPLRIRASIKYGVGDKHEAVVQSGILQEIGSANQ